MTKIISYNVNGIRAAMKKGFEDWLLSTAPDVICLQEIKAMESQIDLSSFTNMGYNVIWNSAKKKGYSGTAIFSKITCKNIQKKIGYEILDIEGRFILTEIDDILLINVYMPSGSNNTERQKVKLDFLRYFESFIADLKKNYSRIIICGDFNICHLDIDIHNPKMNIKTPGWTPIERSWMQSFIENQQFEDGFRAFNKSPHNYTWWSYRARARPKNLGWRIDYQLVSEALMPQLKRSVILSQAYHSDHCPICIAISE